MIQIIDPTTKRNFSIGKCKGATAPAQLTMTYPTYYTYDRVCGYWESAAELIMWACEIAKVDPEQCFYLFSDKKTVYYWDDIIEMEDNDE